MINFLQATAPVVEPQPGFMQQYSFLIMLGLMFLVMWLFMWRPEAKRRKQMQEFR
ncbi:MAG: preprotein translocase subunit YajC, partial [Alistipes sp.]|nr:preprotein translocase subunit YajC [Alistipes sp.]